jgi:hypothetical protein
LLIRIGWSELMAEEPNYISEPDVGLDQTRELVARILEFVASRRERLTRFLHMTSFRPEIIRETTLSPLFMLSVLDTVMKDQQLQRELQEHEQIVPVMIELAQARLGFHIASEVTQQREGEAEASAIRARVRQQLRVLLRLSRGAAEGTKRRF